MFVLHRYSKSLSHQDSYSEPELLASSHLSSSWSGLVTSLSDDRHYQLAIMVLHKALSIALFVALSCASPLPKEPTKVLPRALPTPSDYPFDDGSCEQEWKYLNFNKNDDTDKAHLEKLHWVISYRQIRSVLKSGRVDYFHVNGSGPLPRMPIPLAPAR